MSPLFGSPAFLKDLRNSQASTSSKSIARLYVTTGLAERDFSVTNDTKAALLDGFHSLHQSKGSEMPAFMKINRSVASALRFCQSGLSAKTALLSGRTILAAA